MGARRGQHNGPAIRMDVNDIKRRFPGKCDQHIEEMVNSLKHTKRLQAMLTKRGWTIDEHVLLA